MMLASIMNYTIANAPRIIGIISAVWGIISFFIEIKDNHKFVLTKRTAFFLLVGVIFFAIGTDWASVEISKPETPSPAVTDANPVVSENGEPTQESDSVEDSEPVPDSLAPSTPDIVETNASGHTEPGTSGNYGSGEKATPPPTISKPVVEPSPTVSFPPATTAPPVTVYQVALDYTEAALIIGDTKALLATVSYSDGTNDHSAIWTSSNPNVATVDASGTVTALSAGTTQITAQASKNNVSESASCAITVGVPPIAPTGYSIRLSTDHAMITEQFRVYVIPNEDDITEIRIFAISPSGQCQDFPLSESGLYLIDTEVGTWTIYASVTNAVGTYMGSKEMDSVTIEITGIMDKFDDLFPGLW